MYRYKAVILSAVVLMFFSGCKKSPESSTEHTETSGIVEINNIENDAEKPLPVQTPQSKQTTVQLDADTELCFSDAPCVASDDSAIQPMATKQKGGCNPLTIPKHAVCKNSEIYCGDAKAPQNLTGWKCINAQWVCVSDACDCGDQKTGKYGLCIGNKPFCGESEIAAPKDPGYICQNNTYVCANPTGCKCGKGDCPQFGKCSNNKCDKGKVKTGEQPVLCEKGNCTCGDGACAQDAYCYKERCICGSPEYSNTIETFDVGYIISNQFGDFKCNRVESESYYSQCEEKEVIDYLYTISCEKPDGCKLNGKLMPASNHGDKSWDDKCGYGYSASDRFEQYHCNYNAEQYYDGPETLFASDEEESKFVEDYNNYYLELGCGRKTALDFQLGPSLQINENEDDYVTSATFSCQQMSRCDTMPVPRKDRSKYLCDRVLSVEQDGYLEDWYDFDHFEYNVAGLRCNDDGGCPCFDDTCVKGQLCYEGVCMYDDIYASRLCRSFIKDIDADRMLAIEPDNTVLENSFYTFDYKTQTVIKLDGPIRWSGENCADVDEETNKPIPADVDLKDYEGIVVTKCSKSDSVDNQYGVIGSTPAATSVPVLWSQKDMMRFSDYDGYYARASAGPAPESSTESAEHGFYNNYHRNTEGIHITPSGICICGQSLYTPEIANEYVCNPNRGYLCTAENGCKCGSAHCDKASYCLRSGVCAKLAH